MTGDLGHSGLMCRVITSDECRRYDRIQSVHDTSPKTTLPKRHFAEKTLGRKDTLPKTLPKFGENAEKVEFDNIQSKT